MSRAPPPAPLDQELRCRVCNEFYSEPAKLQCGHHMCQRHVEQYLNRNRLQCPFCLEISVLPDTGLPLDRTLQVVTEVWKEVQAAPSTDDGEEVPRMCGFCEDKPASRRCVQCAGVLCSECESVSHSKGFFKSHTVVNLDVGPSGPDFAERMTCDSHTQERLSFYCHDCKRPVCSHCLILGDHKGHHQTPIDQAYQMGQDTLKAWRDKLQQRIDSTQDLLGQLRGAEVEVAQNAELQRNTINHELDHLRELIETKRQQLLSKSLLEEKQKRTTLQTQLERAETTRHESACLVQRAQDLLNLSSEHAFLTIMLPLVQDMKGSLNRPLDNTPQVCCVFRPLSTDPQVRCLGDLDLGHPRASHHGGHASLVGLAGSPLQPLQVQSMHAPVPAGAALGSMDVHHANFGVPHPGYSMAGATLSYLPAQAMPVQQVQIVYRSVQAQ